jgi:ABC-2 type transport system permease protein
MKGIAFFVPASHVFEGMRAILLRDAAFPARELVWAFAIDLLYVAGAAALFAWSLRQVRDRGLLSRFGE